MIEVDAVGVPVSSCLRLSRYSLVLELPSFEPLLLREPTHLIGRYEVTISTY